MKTKKVDSPCPDGITMHMLRPTRRQVLVEALEDAEMSQGGIIMLSAPNDDDDIWTNAQPPSLGVVREHGPDCLREWSRQVSEAVVFLPNSGVSFVSGGRRWIVFEEEAILGVCTYTGPIL